jgi:hypothetical protein
MELGQDPTLAGSDHAHWEYCILYGTSGPRSSALILVRFLFVLSLNLRRRCFAVLDEIDSVLILCRNGGNSTIKRYHAFLEGGEQK